MTVFYVLSMAPVTHLDFSGSGSPINLPNELRIDVEASTNDEAQFNAPPHQS
jgi:hypothetical protein